MATSAEKKEAFKMRTKTMALCALKESENLPRKIGTGVIAKQLARSATSVAANYRADCRARSDAECVAKLGIVEEEADETMFWLELAMEGGYLEDHVGLPLWKECNEITDIVVTSIKNLKANKSK